MTTIPNVPDRSRSTLSYHRAAAFCTAIGGIWLGLVGCNPVCVAEGTAVLLPSGTIEIEALRLGDTIMCVDVATGELIETTITAIRQSMRECMVFEFGDGRLECTPDHPVWSPERNTYTYAGEWITGGLTLLSIVEDGMVRRREVESTKAYSANRRVFDLSVASEHSNFVAGGVVVHNKQCPLPGCETAGTGVQTQSTTGSTGVETEGTSESSGATTEANSSSTSSSTSTGSSSTGAYDPCSTCGAGEVCVATIVNGTCALFDLPFDYTCVPEPAECAGQSGCAADDCLTTLCGVGGSCETYDCSPPAEFEVDFVCGYSMLKTCDVWEQDCDEGEKCQAWYDTEYNPPVCLPVSGDGAAGEPCEVSPDGIDDCGADSQCWNVDPMTKVGTCIPRCDGTAEMPECPEGATCSSYFDGTINVCVLDCDPLEGVEACAEDEVCSPMNGDFHCFPAGGAMGLGEDCEFLNSCAPGLVCVPADLVIGCEESKVGNCCSPACDLTDPNGCDALPGNECKPWDEEQPESDLGICALY